MRRKLTAIAVLAATAVTLVAVAAAGPVAAKQRVSIELKGNVNESFVLTPLTSGALKSDTGVASSCCCSSRHIMRDGLAIEVNDPQLTLKGKGGTLVLRNQIEWVDIPDSWAVFAATWKIVSGTGVYAKLSGGGRGGGVQLLNGTTKSTFEGFVSPK
jgi:hypothetical protein